MPSVVFTVNGEELTSDFPVQRVADFRQELAMKLGPNWHVFSRYLFVAGEAEPLMNGNRVIAISGRAFELRK
jgi:hypothetical protein